MLLLVRYVLSTAFPFLIVFSMYGNLNKPATNNALFFLPIYGRGALTKTIQFLL